MAIHLTKLLNISRNYIFKYPNYLTTCFISKRNIQEFPDLKLNNELPKDHLIVLSEQLNEKPETNELLRFPKAGEREINFSKINVESIYKGLSQVVCSYENFITDLNEEIRSFSNNESLEEIFKDIEKYLYPMDTVANILNVLINVDKNNYQYKEIYDLLERYYSARDSRFGPVFKERMRYFTNEKYDSLSEADKKLLHIYFPRNPQNNTSRPMDESTLTHFKKHLKDDVNRFRFNLNVANQVFSHTIDDPDILAKVSNEFDQCQDLHHKERTPLRINIDTYQKFMSVCPDRFIRQNLWQVRNRRCSPKAHPKYNNMSYINSIRILRRRIANICGYRSHVEFKLIDAMANSKQEIIDNLTMLNETNSKILRERLQELNDFAEDNSFEDSSGFGIQEYDIDYWSHKYTYDILIGKSESELKTYFPLGKVLLGLKKYFNEYFGIELKQKQDFEKNLWSNDVIAYDVFRNNNPVGSFIYDPYIRNVKASLDPFCARLRNKNNDLGCLPLRLISTSYVKDNKTKQAQLSMSDIINLFYCYGIVIQRLLYNYKYYELNTYGGLQVDVNNFFPNLCVSNLLTDHRILQSCSDRGGSKSIDTESSQRILKALTHFKSFRTWRDLYKSHLDLEVHSVVGDMKSIAPELYSKYSPFQRDSDNFDYCSMDDIFVGPNDGVQYSDLWSKQLVNYYLNNDKLNQSINTATNTIDVSKIKEINAKLLDELFDGNNFNTGDRITSFVGRSFEPLKTGLGML